MKYIEIDDQLINLATVNLLEKIEVPEVEDYRIKFYFPLDDYLLVNYASKEEMDKDYERIKALICQESYGRCC